LLNGLGLITRRLIVGSQFELHRFSLNYCFPVAKLLIFNVINV
jgi:hypothetical protein